MSYAELLQKLFQLSLFQGMKPGLDNALLLSKALGFPEKCFRSIHVGGTNGKGTVTIKIASALSHAGYKVGHYTSPHLASFRERMQINQELISESQLEQLLDEVFSAAERLNISATFFEITTLTAFLWFAKENVDFAVVEVGLGGRLDTTNIIIPELSIITSISLDHTEILGDTIEAIALDKAGIIKPTIPVVVGPRTPQALLQEIALKQNSPCIKVKEHCSNYLEENSAIAQAALTHLSISQEAINQGLKACQPCRFELPKVYLEGKSVNTPIILDVAHNPDGIKHLCLLLRQRYPAASVRVLCGLSKSKDLEGCLTILKNEACAFHLVEATNGRGAPVEQLQNILQQLKVPPSAIFLESSILQGVHHAIKLAMQEKEILLICGSFFIMREARAALGIQEPCDPIDLNERIISYQKPHIKAVHDAWRQTVKPGDTVVDATCGNGYDTLLLAQLTITPNAGAVFALDIQKQAIEKTQKRLQKKHPESLNRVHFFQGCHSFFPKEILPESAKLVVYNLGYLPNGKKELITKANTTCLSLNQALDLVCKGGMLSITCYPGHPGGTEEMEAVIKWATRLPEGWSSQILRWGAAAHKPIVILVKKVKPQEPSETTPKLADI